MAYRIVLRCILSNGRLKTIIGNDCLKGCTGDKQEKKICCHCTYYPNIVQSVTIRTYDKNNSTSTLSKSINRHMKENRLNKVSGTIIFLNIPIIGIFCTDTIDNRAKFSAYWFGTPMETINLDRNNHSTHN